MLSDIESPRGFFIYLSASMTSPFAYLKHVRDEFAHIVWPSPRTALGHTLVVIIIAIVIGVLVAVLDYVFGSVVSHVAGA